MIGKNTEKAIKFFLEIASYPEATLMVDYLHAIPKRKTVKVGLIATFGLASKIVEIDLKQLIAKRGPKRKEAKGKK